MPEIVIAPPARYTLRSDALHIYVSPTATDPGEKYVIVLERSCQPEDAAGNPAGPRRRTSPAVRKLADIADVPVTVNGETKTIADVAKFVAAAAEYLKSLDLPDAP